MADAAVKSLASGKGENEILAVARMKSANADEIFGVASDEIKSTLPPSRRISSPQGISSSKTISSTRKGGFNCKRPDAKHLVFCWWGRTDSFAFSFPWGMKIEVLMPSSRHQATVHRTVAFWIFESIHPSSTTKNRHPCGQRFLWWGRTDSNHRSETQQIYSLSPLATRELPHILFSSSVEPVDGLV